MTFETVTLHPNGFRVHFRTDDPEELAAHLELLDALQIRRPRHLQTPRCWWAADVWLSDNSEMHPVRVWAAPEDVDFAMADIVKNQASYYRCEAKLFNVKRDLT